MTSTHCSRRGGCSNFVLFDFISIPQAYLCLCGRSAHVGIFVLGDTPSAERKNWLTAAGEPFPPSVGRCPLVATCCPLVAQIQCECVQQRWLRLSPSDGSHYIEMFVWATICHFNIDLSLGLCFRIDTVRSRCTYPSTMSFTSALLCLCRVLFLFKLWRIQSKEEKNLIRAKKKKNNQKNDMSLASAMSADRRLVMLRLACIKTSTGLSIVDCPDALYRGSAHLTFQLPDNGLSSTTFQPRACQCSPAHTETCTSVIALWAAHPDDICSCACWSLAAGVAGDPNNILDAAIPGVVTHLCVFHEVLLVSNNLQFGCFQASCILKTTRFISIHVFCRKRPLGRLSAELICLSVFGLPHPATHPGIESAAEK